MAKAADEIAPDTEKPLPRGAAAVLSRHLMRARAGLPAPPVRATVPQATPERAIATAIGRAAQAACGMPIYPLRAGVTAATLAELPELLPERSLILAVEGPLGALGVVALCPAMLAAVIEMQSLGRVTRQPPRDRRPTRTDASICADFVNAGLAELAKELGPLLSDSAMPDYRFASFVEDPKPLELMLEDIAYRCLRLDMRVGQGGVRDAALLVFLPDDGTAPIMAPQASGHAAAAPSAGRSLAEAVRAAPVQLNAVLCRRKISLRELRGLQTGSVLTLPHDAMATARLETSQGLLIAQGKLGALHGCRAIRVNGRAGAAADPAAFADAAGGEPAGASDNVFAGDVFADDLPDDDIAMSASLLAEPPQEDVDLPDPFRAIVEDDEAEAPTMPLSASLGND
ncbi:FliM/FliN family flagellar motor switch protein [Paracoccus xiamenensis]|uniref:FliM/FliN family flagellar motor switch protein n=1 Tax=Paracoccus xiamenensis TaxID=2714901 RepID=UPI001407E332|nr:FliM/FliN family flagellar motor switch protein [Paracoccus xiamenensis]NHF74270.1 hypothetical protein [Paracoccus xiamenensis]